MPAFKPTPVLLVLTACLIFNSGCASNAGDGGSDVRSIDFSARPSFNRVALAAASDIGPPARNLEYADALRMSGHDSAEHLGVMTFNMEHKGNADHLAVMAQHLRSDLGEMPDFVLCQEVMFHKGRYEGRDNTAEVLADTLGYHVRATQRTSDNEGVAILSRYPFDFYAAHELKSQTSRFLLGFNRVSVMGEFVVPALGRVRVANVHFTNWRFEERVRTNQLRETLQWIAEREQQVHADITILGGDFNMLPDGDERPLVSDHRETGTLEFHDFNTSEPTRGPRGYPNARVDYVFIANPTCDVRFLGEQRMYKDGLQANVGSERFYLSDHVPVLHEYGIRPRVIAAQQPGPAASPIIDAATAAATTLMR